MDDPLRLYGLRALVLNAGNGIGEANARTLLRHGAQVLAVDSKHSDIEQYYARVKGITGLAAGILDAESLADVAGEAVDLLGGIDILVNQFPIPQEAPYAHDSERFEHALKLRASLLAAMSRAALPHIRRSPQGRIINMGMLRSEFAADANDLYRKSERSLAIQTRELAADIGEYGITANYVQPGGVMTPTSREVFRRNDGLRDHCIAASAARRLGEPVDIAKVVLFFASDDAVFVSGTGLVVDGGRSGDLL